MATSHPHPDRWTLRRIGIVGAGGVGTSLAAAIGDRVPVVMVCHSPHRAAQVFRDGVRLDGPHPATAHPIVVRTLADLETVGGVSCLFIATKTTAIPALAAELRPLMARIGDQPGAPFIVSYQNGIEPGRLLRQMLDDTRVLRVVINSGVSFDPATGIARLSLEAPPHAIGSIEPEFHPVCHQIAELMTRSGLQTIVADDIERRVWAKSVVNAAMNPVAALVNTTIGEVLSSPARVIVDNLLREGLAVARAEGLDLGPDYLDAAYRMLDAGRAHTPSMVEDIRAGRKSEVGQLNRQIIDHGRARNVPTPTHEIIDALIETFDWKVYLQAAARATPPS
jgi:2-dehydropantoate 2-reductase